MISGRTLPGSGLIIHLLSPGNRWQCGQRNLRRIHLVVILFERTLVLTQMLHFEKSYSKIGGEELALRRWRRFVGLYLEDGYDEDHADLGRPLMYHVHETGSQPRTRQQLNVRHQHAGRVRRRSRYVPSYVDRIHHAHLSPLSIGLSPLKIRGGAIASSTTDRIQSGRSTRRKHQVDGNLRLLDPSIKDILEAAFTDSRVYRQRHKNFEGRQVLHDRRCS